MTVLHETQQLDALVGRWRSEGHIIGDPPVPITGTDIYEWLPGNFFLVHHVDVAVGDQKVQALEIIGERDPATGRLHRSRVRQPRRHHPHAGHR